MFSWPVPSSRSSALLPFQRVLAPGAVPDPMKFWTVSPLAEPNALPNWAATLSSSDKFSKSTVPLFSTFNVNVTSQSSPFRTASPAALVNPISGMYSGVGSSGSLPGSAGSWKFCASVGSSEISLALPPLDPSPVDVAEFSSTPAAL